MLAQTSPFDDSKTVMNMLNWKYTARKIYKMQMSCKAVNWGQMTQKM